MKKFLLFALMGLFWLTSCDKQDTELTVTLKNSGRFKVKLVGKDGNGISDVKLQLYFSSTSSSSSFDSKKTDANGSVDFGELMQGIYYVYAKDVKIGNSKYNVNKGLMLTSGFTGEFNIDPTEFVGKITFTLYVQGNMGSSKGSNINIALIESTDYRDTLTHEEKLAKAVAIGVTDQNGKVVFDKIPSGYMYVAYIYKDEIQNTVAFGGNIYVNTNDEREIDLTVSESDLNNIKYDLNLTAYYYGYKNGTDYNSHNLTNINVLAVTYDDYVTYNLQYRNLSIIQSYAKAQGVTNSLGKVNLSLKGNKSYYILVYYSDAYKSWGYNSFYMNNSDYSTMLEFDENSLGISK